MRLAKIIATCENLDGIAPPLPESTPVERQEAETELIDVETQAEADYKSTTDIDTGMDEAITSMDRLEEARDVVADGDNQEVTAVELATVESLVANIHYSLGIPRNIPTLESHSVQNRAELVATMESAVQNIKNALINGMKAAWEAVKRFVNNLLQNKDALKRYLQGVAVKLQGKTGNLGVADVAGFCSGESAMEGVKTAHVLMDMIQTTADAFNEISAKDKSDIDGSSSHKVAKAIGERTNKILLSGTKVSGAGEGGQQLRGLISGNRGMAMYVDGAQLKFERPIKYSVNPFNTKPLSVQDATDILRQAISTLERLAGMKKFENVLAGAFKILAGGIGSQYNHYKAKTSEGATARNLEQTEHKKEGDKKVMVAAFRGVAHVYGATLPREVFNNLSNVGKYIDAAITAGNKPAANAEGQAPQAGTEQKA